jgi:hypothetical protein
MIWSLRLDLHRMLWHGTRSTTPPRRQLGTIHITYHDYIISLPPCKIKFGASTLYFASFYVDLRDFTKEPFPTYKLSTTTWID